ncbi:amine sulfotransferase [Agrilus planipennis]|uniref:Amine sulfotransferase n=1 Tax=Agrilus planipennis TaxID=224129 RepID=A0A1W4WAZ7_AGRPL|nr:amine sulfotransferase [Agrilus planipennis]
MSKTDCTQISDDILDKKWVNTFRKGYVSVKGVTLPLRYKDLAEDIENLEVYDDDVWVCSFPKTGTTWTQEIVWLLCNNLDYEGAKENIGSRFPFLDFSFLFDYRDNMIKNSEFQPLDFQIDSLKYVAELKRPRLIKTHLPYFLLPRQIREGIKKPKIIYVFRNPKDTCNSYYHHSLLLEGFTGSLEEFCKLFLEGKVPFGPYWTNVISFWENRNKSNILILRFEDLKRDLRKVVETVCTFLKKSIPNEEQMKKFLEHLSFEKMKTNTSLNYEDVVAFNKKFDLIQFEGSFMRGGKVGGYKEALSQEFLNKLDSLIKKATEGTAISFD